MQTANIVRWLRLGCITLCWGAAIIPLLIFGARAVHAFRADAVLTHPSGVIAALAQDLQHGLFYRPLYDPALGYGGTRYFPLSFGLQGLWMTLGVPARASLYLFSALSAAVYGTGLFALARRLGASRAMALWLSVLGFSARSTQFVLLAGRGDVLPVGFLLWGLWFCASERGRRDTTFAAALCFGLAFATKVTALHGLAAATLYGLGRGDHRRVVALLCGAVACCACVVIGMQVLSSGRALDIMRASALAGGSLAQMSSGPLQLARLVRDGDPSLVGWLSLAAVALASPPHANWPGIPAWALLCALGSLALVMGSPGMDYNHLVDLHATCLIVLAGQLRASAQPFHRLLWMVAGASATLLGVQALRDDAARERAWYPKQRFTQIVAYAREQGPVLAENPLIAVLAGARPYVLDPFMLRVLAGRDPSLMRPALARLRARYFATVVLEEDPRTEEGARFYAAEHFGAELVQAVLANYEFTRMIDGHYVFGRKR